MMPGAVTTRNRKSKGQAARIGRVDRARGRLRAARQVASPNCDDRPPGVDASLIVIHGISLPPGKFGGPWIERLFTNRLPPERHPFFRKIETLKVSSHLVIRRGGTILQFVPLHRRAWHAGKSSYRGREGCNDFSIGIELEGTDRRAYSDAQYRALARVVRALLAAYPTLSADRIAGHSDIAPGRKSDPGAAFDWARLKAALAR
jgi:AmpD protein